MTALLVYSLALLIAALLAFPLIPSAWAAKHRRGMGVAVTALIAIQFFVALIAAGTWIANGLQQDSAADFTVMGAGLHYALIADGWLRLDGISSLMLLMVSFVGWVIGRYSMRYLDGELAQGRYFQWTGFTLGAVSLMVLSGHLGLLAIAWVMIHIGLHQLLLHYRDRPVAVQSAKTKFAISRVGDVALIAALLLIYQQLGTLQLGEIFSAVSAVGFLASPPLIAACWLIGLTAISKSVQFPFHTWLPHTLETPTPVSALMHAGIVNAGGYLIIRTSPLMSHAHLTLAAIAVIGGFTACFAAVVMLTQTSVKKSLAYSTIAQMGFMMLQCGLGAYSAAMLHILAHSLYKAHAFLGSGGVLEQPANGKGRVAGNVAGAAVGSTRVRWLDFGLAIMIVGLFYAASLALFGLNPAAKPGGVVLGVVLCGALAYWVGQVMASGCSRSLVRALPTAGGLCFVYVALFSGVDWMVSSSLPAIGITAAYAWLPWVVMVTVLACFAGVLWLSMQLAEKNSTTRNAMVALNIHASNGFYVDAFLRRVFGSLASE